VGFASWSLGRLSVSTDPQGRDAERRDPEPSEGNSRIGVLRLLPESSEGQDMTQATAGTLARLWSDSG